MRPDLIKEREKAKRNKPELFIKVKIKEVYGEDLVYPVCDKAKTFAALAGTKTLTNQSRKLIKDLGYDIIQYIPTDIRI